jgi:hypothetical protein
MAAGSGIWYLALLAMIKSLRDARSRRDAVIDVQDRCAGAVPEGCQTVPARTAPHPVHGSR